MISNSPPPDFTNGASSVVSPSPQPSSQLSQLQQQLADIPSVPTPNPAPTPQSQHGQSGSGSQLAQLLAAVNNSARRSQLQIQQQMAQNGLIARSGQQTSDSDEPMETPFVFRRTQSLGQQSSPFLSSKTTTSQSESQTTPSQLSKTFSVLLEAAKSTPNNQPENQQQLPETFFQGPVLPHDCVTFEVAQLPGPDLSQPAVAAQLLSTGAVMQSQQVFQSNSRLLFHTLAWIKQLPAFRFLQSDIQMRLLQNSWHILFAIGMAQSSKRFSIPNILSAVDNHLRLIMATKKDSLSTNSSKSPSELCEQNKILASIVEQCDNLECDAPEFGFLRLLAFFSAGL